MKKITFLSSEYNLPKWLVCLNYTNFVGFLIWPFAVIVSYARLGDYSFAQLSKWEYLLIWIYPILLLISTVASFKLYSINKVISAIIPLAIIVFYIFRLYRSITYHF